MSRQVFNREDLTQGEFEAAYKSYEAKRKGVSKRKDRTGLVLEMRLTFDQWLDIWLESGKLVMRGLRKGQYCMARKQDLGHYEIGNVFIQLASENARDAKLGRPGLKGRVSPTKGMTQSDESNALRSKAKLRQPKRPCPHCKRNFDPASLGRHHGDRCKIFRLAS